MLAALKRQLLRLRDFVNMTELSRGIFNCLLLTRNKCLLDCKAKSLVVPAHDGQLGILRNHCPILTELGLGILSVKGIQSDEGETVSHFLIDGGFLKISENHVTILAYDVEVFEGLSMDQVDEMVKEAEKLLEADAFSPQIRDKQIKKAILIKQLAELSAISKD